MCSLGGGIVRGRILPGRRSLLVGSVQEIEIDIVGSQPLQASLHLLCQDFPREDERFARLSGCRRLGGDDRLTPAFGEPLTQGGLRSAPSVGFGRVKEIDADVQTIADQLVSLSVISSAAEMAPKGCPLAHSGHVQISMTELDQMGGSAADRIDRRCGVLAARQIPQPGGPCGSSASLQEMSSIAIDGRRNEKPGMIRHIKGPHSKVGWWCSHQ